MSTPDQRSGTAQLFQKEIWRVKYEPRDAYRDQTGMPHSGHVVYERIIVTETGERYDVDDGYSVHPNHGRVCVADDGRRFRLHTETVEYSGGTHIAQEDKPERQPDRIERRGGDGPEQPVWDDVTLYSPEWYRRFRDWHHAEFPEADQVTRDNLNMLVERAS